MKPAFLISMLFTLLLSAGGCPTGSLYAEAKPRVRFNTTAGSFVIELDPNSAPLTVENFLTYVNTGFYDGTIIHRVVPGFVVEAGGYTADLTLKEARLPVRSEARNGLRNERGSVGLARLDDPDSGTSQFYINLLNNFSLDATLTSDGYTVFGFVVDGMDTIDAIALTATTSRDELSDVPVENIVIESIEFEPGSPTLSPEYQAYYQSIQAGVLSAGRDALVSILQGVITGQ